jgi:hypothetical protein
MRGPFWCKTKVWWQPDSMPYGGVCVMRGMPYEGFDCITLILLTRLNTNNNQYLYESRNYKESRDFNKRDFKC